MTTREENLVLVASAYIDCNQHSTISTGRIRLF